MRRPNARRTPVAALTFAALCLWGLPFDAQSVREPSFEVTSVRPNRSGAMPVGGAGDHFSNGELRTTNIPLRLLIRQVFERYRDDDVLGGPAWLDGDRWDIAAKAESPDADMRPMIRTLLADRFGLVTHLDTRERPVYVLRLARRDGRLGPGLRPASGTRDFLGSAGSLRGTAVTMRDVAALLGSDVDRPVVDRTGLTAAYDVDLNWVPAASAGAGALDASDLPSIFTAVEEQLGLKLEAARAPVEVLVIDRAQRPDPD